MENHEPDPTIVLKVNMSCCSDCPKKLRKVLSTIYGVQSVAVDQEKNLVFVAGNNVDPKLLIRTIERMGKKVDLECHEELKKEGNVPTDDNHHHAADSSHHNDDPSNNRDQYVTTEDKCPQEGLFFRQQQAAEKSRKCYCEGNPNYNMNKKKKKEDEHKIENFEEQSRSQEFNAEVCGDPYCRIHRRSRIILEGMPPIIGGNRPPMFYKNVNQQPFLGGLNYGRGHFHPPYLPQGGRGQPPRYAYPMSIPPPPAYGGWGFLPMGASFGYNEGPNRRCSIM